VAIDVLRGLPRRGKTFAQRLPSAAGVLDAYVRHYIADGKGGADWRPMRGVAHRLVIGAEDEAIERFRARLDELITEMGRRFAVLGTLPTSVCPEGKLTPDVSRRYDLPVIFITIDELQEYLSAMPGPLKEDTVEKLARLAWRAPAAEFHPQRRLPTIRRRQRARETAGDHHLTTRAWAC
jgi:S-DNA-T family DNA segregation ATPase FtsK/SpoIIIE